MLPPPLIALAAWVVPGLGHWLLGRRAKALYLGCLILAAFLTGLLLGQFHSVAHGKFPYYWIGQMGAAGPALVSDLLFGSAPQGHTVDRLELGLVFTTVAGIMNVVAMVDAYTIARLRKEPAA